MILFLSEKQHDDEIQSILIGSKESLNGWMKTVNPIFLFSHGISFVFLAVAGGACIGGGGGEVLGAIYDGVISPCEV